MYEIKKADPLNVSDDRMNFLVMPLNDMNVGDYFFIEGTEEFRNRIAFGLAYHGKKLNKKFALRKTDGGFNVFRKI